MRRVVTAIIAASLSIGTARAQVALQHGRLEPRGDATPALAIASLGSNATPVWIAWQVPMVPGLPSPCSSWSDETGTVRQERLGTTPLAAAAPMDPPRREVRLDAGTRLTVLARVLSGQLERLRIAGDDCPIDAAGQTVSWLERVTAAASVTFLEQQTQVPALAIADGRRLAESAINALSYHDGDAATSALDRLTLPSVDARLQRLAARGLARARGAHGLERVSALIRNEQAPAARQALVSALAESPLPAASDMLLSLAQSDPHAGVRGEAAYWHVRRLGATAVPAAKRLLDTERDDNAARRIVAGLATAPPDVAVPALLDLARSTTRLAVRKEAVQALGRTGNPEAMRYLEELVGRQ